MVKLRGPGLSTHAGGTLADQLIFSNWKGRAYLKTHRKPKQPRSPGQVAMRAMMSFLSAEWAQIIPENQATWDELAKHDNVSPFNAYQGYNLQRWASFEAPSKKYPALEFGTAPTTTPLVLFGLRHAIRVTYSVTIAASGWGNDIHHVTGSGQPVHYNDLLHVEPCAGAEDKDFLITGLAAGLHWLAIAAFSTTGHRWAPTSWSFATVTD